MADGDAARQLFQEIDQLRQSHEKVIAEVHESNARLTQLTSEYNRLSGLIASCDSEKTEWASKASRVKASLYLKRKMHEDLLERKKVLKSEAALVATRIEKCEHERDSLLEELSRESKTFWSHEYHDLATILPKDDNLREHERSVELLQKDVQLLESKISAARQHMDENPGHCETQMQLAKSQIEGAEKRRQDIVASVSRIDQEIASTNTEIAKIHEEIKSILEPIEKL